MPLTYLNRFYLTPWNSEQSPRWEANSYLASQEITSLLLNPMVYYGVYNIPPLVPFLSDKDQVHVTASSFSEVNAILSSTSVSHKWSLFSD
jgi:hypothetical protein